MDLEPGKCWGNSKVSALLTRKAWPEKEKVKNLKMKIFFLYGFQLSIGGTYVGFFIWLI